LFNGRVKLSAHPKVLRSLVQRNRLFIFSGHLRRDLHADKKKKKVFHGNGIIFETGRGGAAKRNMELISLTCENCPTSRLRMGISSICFLPSKYWRMVPFSKQCRGVNHFPSFLKTRLAKVASATHPFLTMITSSCASSLNNFVKASRLVHLWE